MLPNIRSMVVRCCYHLANTRTNHAFLNCHSTQNGTRMVSSWNEMNRKIFDDENSNDIFLSNSQHPHKMLWRMAKLITVVSSMLLLLDDVLIKFQAQK